MYRCGTSGWRNELRRVGPLPRSGRPPGQPTPLWGQWAQGQRAWLRAGCDSEGVRRQGLRPAPVGGQTGRAWSVGGAVARRALPLGSHAVLGSSGGTSGRRRPRLGPAQRIGVHRPSDVRDGGRRRRPVAPRRPAPCCRVSASLYDSTRQDVTRCATRSFVTRRCIPSCVSSRDDRARRISAMLEGGRGQRSPSLPEAVARQLSVPGGVKNLSCGCLGVGPWG